MATTPLTMDSPPLVVVVVVVVVPLASFSFSDEKTNKAARKGVIVSTVAMLPAKARLLLWTKSSGIFLYHCAILRL